MAPSIISFRMLPIMTTTMTNGVSFSLVAGAVCGINFSKTVQGSGTLNINSTGAKNYDTYAWSITGSFASGTYVTESYCKYILAIYTGSNYMFTSTFERSGLYTDSD